MIDRDRFLGWRTPPHRVEIDKSMIRRFAQAIGSQDPLHHHEAAARAAGYRGLLAPPTFAFSIYLMDGKPTFWRMREMGAVLGRGYHGETAFDYQAPICAGDVVDCESVISDISDKKGGAMTLVTETSRLSDSRGELLVALRNVFIIVNGSTA